MLVHPRAKLWCINHTRALTSFWWVCFCICLPLKQKNKQTNKQKIEKKRKKNTGTSLPVVGRLAQPRWRSYCSQELIHQRSLQEVVARWISQRKLMSLAHTNRYSRHLGFISIVFLLSVYRLKKWWVVCRFRWIYGFFWGDSTAACLGGWARLRGFSFSSENVLVLWGMRNTHSWFVLLSGKKRLQV